MSDNAGKREMDGMRDDIRKHEKRALEIIAGMEPWWRELNKKTKPHRDGRSVKEQCFDSGVFAAAEFIRRLTKDASLSLAIHELCFWARRNREKGFDPDGNALATPESERT